MTHPTHFWFDVIEVAKTDKAYLFTFSDAGEDLWIPKSQVGGKNERGQIERVELTQWITLKNSLIEI